MPVGASLAETDHVLGHELVHAFQFAMTGQGRISSTNAPAARPCRCGSSRAWRSTCPSAPSTPTPRCGSATRRARRRCPPSRELDEPRTSPTATARRSGPTWRAASATRSWATRSRARGAQSNDAGEILEAVVGVDAKTLSKDWHAAHPRRRRAAAGADARAPSDYANPLVTEAGDGGDVNVGPALSPDGSRLAFLSERDQFSIELFVADAKTGKVMRRLSRQAVDPHVESLQFINSAGAWNREGTQVALGAVSKGRPLLVILDARHGRQACARCRCPTLGEVFRPRASRRTASASCSPRSSEGSPTCSSTISRPRHLRRLTEDAYADLQPAWSPDGRRIVFVTDRFSTDLPRLHAGDYGLALIDVDSAHDQRAARRSPRPRTSTRSGAGPATPSTSSPTPTAPPTSTVSIADGALLPAHRPADRHQRHHRAQPGADRRRPRGPPRLLRVRGREVRDLFHRRLRAHGRLGGGERRTP